MYPGRDPLLSSLISSRAIVARQSSDAPTNIAWCDEMDRPPRVVDRISRSHILSLKLVVLAFPLHSIVILVNCDNRRGISCRRLFSGENRIRWEDPTSTLLCNKNLVELFRFIPCLILLLHSSNSTNERDERIECGAELTLKLFQFQATHSTFWTIKVKSSDCGLQEDLFTHNN